MDDFFRYIDSLGKLDDDDLYLDIDETMERRERDKPKAEMTSTYGQKKAKN